MTTPLKSEKAAGLRNVANSYPSYSGWHDRIDGTPQLPLLARILQAYYRTNLRGRTGVTLLLARHSKSLQAVPIRIAGWPPVYVDLRLLNAHFWLIGTPFAHSPIETDEQIVMRKFVREGDTVFDIGANFGLHTALLAQLTTDAADFLVGLPRPGYQIFEIGGGGTLQPVRSADLERRNQNVLAVPGERARGPELA